MEIWKDIIGYEGIYKISNLGRVKSLGRYINGKIKGSKSFLKEKILKNRLDKDGYRIVGLYKNGKLKTMPVHRIVAISFIPNSENKRTVNHINGIKTDNRVENLEWNTDRENIAHAIYNGLRDNNGVNNFHSKLTKEQVILIRSSNETHRIIGERLGIDRSTVGRIKRGKTYKTIL